MEVRASWSDYSTLAGQAGAAAGNKALLEDIVLHDYGNCQEVRAIKAETNWLGGRTERPKNARDQEHATSQFIKLLAEDCGELETPYFKPFVIKGCSTERALSRCDIQTTQASAVAARTARLDAHRRLWSELTSYINNPFDYMSRSASESELFSHLRSHDESRTQDQLICLNEHTRFILLDVMEQQFQALSDQGRKTIEVNQLYQILYDVLSSLSEITEDQVVLHCVALSELRSAAENLISKLSGVHREPLMHDDIFNLLRAQARYLMTSPLSRQYKKPSGFLEHVWRQVLGGLHGTTGATDQARASVSIELQQIFKDTEHPLWHVYAALVVMGELMNGSGRCRDFLTQARHSSQEPLPQSQDEAVDVYATASQEVRKSVSTLINQGIAIFDSLLMVSRSETEQMVFQSDCEAQLARSVKTVLESRKSQVAEELRLFENELGLTYSSDEVLPLQQLHLDILQEIQTSFANPGARSGVETHGVFIALFNRACEIYEQAEDGAFGPAGSHVIVSLKKALDDLAAISGEPQYQCFLQRLTLLRTPEDLKRGERLRLNEKGIECYAAQVLPTPQIRLGKNEMPPANFPGLRAAVSELVETEFPSGSDAICDFLNQSLQRCRDAMLVPVNHGDKPAEHWIEVFAKKLEQALAVSDCPEMQLLSFFFEPSRISALPETFEFAVSRTDGVPVPRALTRNEGDYDDVEADIKAQNLFQPINVESFGGHQASAGLKDNIGNCSLVAGKTIVDLPKDETRARSLIEALHEQVGNNETAVVGITRMLSDAFVSQIVDVFGKSIGVSNLAGRLSRKGDRSDRLHMIMQIARKTVHQQGVGDRSGVTVRLLLRLPARVLELMGICLPNALKGSKCLALNVKFGILLDDLIDSPELISYPALLLVNKKSFDGVLS